MIVEDIKVRINSLTNTLTAILGYLELGEYAKVAYQVKMAVKELAQLAKAVDLLISDRKRQDKRS